MSPGCVGDGAAAAVATTSLSGDFAAVGKGFSGSMKLDGFSPAAVLAMFPSKVA